MKWVLTLVLGGLAITVGFKLLPVYIDNKTVMTIAQELVDDQELKNQPKRHIQSALDNMFLTRDVGHLDPKEVVNIHRDDNGNLVLGVKYEERRKLMYNLEIVAAFDDQISR
jgi:hypothetical protein